jgi:PPOX class probable F420-dependent enzyme
MPNPKSKSTATKENAMSQAEIDAFLDKRQDGRIATNRGDGWWHVTPIWYLWEGGRFYHTFGAGRRHIRNLRKDPKLTLCVDEDNRLTEGLEVGAQSVVCFATAELSNDEDFIREIHGKILTRYLGDQASEYVAPTMAEGRTIATVTPHDWLTWDYSKD